MNGEIFPLSVNNGVGISSGGGTMNEGISDLKEGGNYEYHSKDRVTMSLAEELEAMGPGTELDGSGGVDEVNERLIEMVVLNLSLSVIE